MSSHSSLDRESFQKLLASAFSVQQSGLDTHSLSPLLELQQLIAAGEPDVDEVMHLAADRARGVANATGTAIALLKRDQLAYRAGSGSAATYVGRHVTAMLSVSAHDKARGEILRVENAQTDARIEATICREFGANSLLILPIYHEHALVGVLEVLFDEAHAFQDREVRTYQLMTGLVEEAMFRNSQLDQKKTLATQPTSVPHAIAQITSQMQKFRDEDKSAPGPAPRPWIDQVCRAATELPGLCEPAKAATGTPRGKLVPLHKLRWNVAVACAVTALVIAACWIAYDRRPASSLVTSSLQRSNAAEQQIPFVPAKPAPLNRAPKAQTAAGETEEAKDPGSTFKRVRVGPNEVDYIAEDATIRHFTTKPALPRVLYKEVHIGEDVTIRYFVSKPVSAAASLDRSLPSVKIVPQALPEKAFHSQRDQ